MSKGKGTNTSLKNLGWNMLTSRFKDHSLPVMQGRARVMAPGDYGLTDTADS